MSSVVRSSSSSSSSASCSSDDDGSDDDSASASASASSSSSTTSSRSSQSQSGSSYLFRPHIPFLRQRRGGRGGSGSGSGEMGGNHQEQENQDCSPLEKDVEKKDHYHNGHHQTHQRQRQRHRGSATASAHKKNRRVASSSPAAAAAAWWWSSWRNRNNSNNPFNHQNSSYCLAVALLIWLMVHLPLFEDDNLSSWQQTTTSSRDAAFIRAVQERIHDEKERNPPHEKVRRMILSPRNQNRIQGSSNFWGRDADSNKNSNSNNNNNNNNNWQKNKREEHQKEDMEDMPEGCEFPFEWQTTSFPNCNQLHEIDLRQHLKLAKQQQPPPSTSISPNSNDNNNSAAGAGASASAGAAAADEYYLSSGLWRDVFSMRPADGKTSVVMKLMKPEHPIDTRNWDRHRRDALAMERLTYSPNVVDIYGYCGNTVLIEQAPMGLDVYLEQTQPQRQPQKAQKRHYQSQASNTTSATSAAAAAMTTDLTFHRKLQISLDAARGIAALHSVDIIHADLQTKQFLVDAQGTIKVNDFNRCRFLPRKKNDSSTSLESASSSASSSSFLEICPIRIPSSPGLWRSPEEYSGKPLVAAMDVYSLGNVLHQILMGERPFQSAGAKMLKHNVRLGVHPEINVTTIDHGGASSSSAISRLAILIQLCLERDLEKRISASDLVRELELLLAEEEGRVVVSSVSTTS